MEKFFMKKRIVIPITKKLKNKPALTTPHHATQP